MQRDKFEASNQKKAESSALSRSVLSCAGLTPKAKNDRRSQGETSAACAEYAAALSGREAALAASVAAERALAGARGALAGAAEEARSLKPESYGDPRYWEQRHAKNREEDETYEWYTGYPEEALRQVSRRRSLSS